MSQPSCLSCKITKSCKVAARISQLTFGGRMLSEDAFALAYICRHHEQPDDLCQAKHPSEHVFCTRHKHHSGSHISAEVLYEWSEPTPTACEKAWAEILKRAPGLPEKVPAGFEWGFTAGKKDVLRWVLDLIESEKESIVSENGESYFEGCDADSLTTKVEAELKETK